MAKQLTKKQQEMLNQLAAQFDETLKEASDGFEEDVLYQVDLKGEVIEYIKVKYVKDKSCIISIVPLKKSWWISTRVELDLKPQETLKAKSVTIALVEGSYKGEDYHKCVINAVVQ